ncbi:MAG: transposase [Coriobacteriales bacterium]|nr:transposase [Coriobacteriales bacterium]
MSRQPRKISRTGFYHIYFRGINHCYLFEEDEDFRRFLDIYVGVEEAFSLELHAFCLMENHVHLLLKENEPGDIAAAMRRLLSPYASWFNKKYQRIGALIADRFKSECVETDAYLLTLVRYIHRNPLEAGIVNRIGSYRWSSYNDYLKPGTGLVDAEFILGMFSADPAKAHKEFVDFHGGVDGECEDYSPSDSRRKSEQNVRLEIQSILEGLEPSAVGSLAKHERDALLKSLRESGFSIRQIERATGISRGVIHKSTR